METVNIKINGVQYAVPQGSTVLEAARAAKIEIPTLCYLKDINAIGACRLCLVEVSEGGSPFRLVTACVYPVTEGMEVVDIFAEIPTDDMDKPTEPIVIKTMVISD